MVAGSGWIRDGYDSRDKLYKSPHDKIVPFVDLRKQRDSINGADIATWLKPIYNQGDTWSCVANASAAAYRFTAMKEAAEASNVATLKDPSRLFIYYNARILATLQNIVPGQPPQNPPQIVDRGCQNRNAFKGMNKYGVCSESTWPWKFDDTQPTVKNINDVPQIGAYREATHFPVIGYYRLDPTKEFEEDLTKDERILVGLAALGNLKKCLTEGYPVMFAFKWYYDENVDNVFETSDTGRKVLRAIPQDREHIGPPLENGEPKWGAHVVLCIGYDDSQKQILVQNSYGEDSGPDSGCFWMPYSYVSDWEGTDDFWTVRLVKPY